MNDIAKFEQVDKRIAEKKAQLMQLWSDPEIAPYVAVLRNGHQPQSQDQKELFTPPAGFKNGNGIRETIKNLKLPHRCNNADVEKGLSAANFHSSGDLKRAVRDAMYDLSHGNDAIFKIVTPGKGGRPNIYERV